MKVTKTTTRNGFPTTALSISQDTVERIALAFRHGVSIRLKYTDLKGITHVRDCYIETINQSLHQFTIKHRDFGYRTLCMERVELA